MKKYPLALFIGRFQPFHKGHLYSLKKALELAEKVIIGIGSSNKSDENNPWSYEEREEMVECVLKVEELRGKVVAVVAVPDNPSDEVWAEELVSLVSEFGYQVGEVVGVGNNEWTNRLLASKGVDVVKSGLFRRDELEGVKIRRLMRAGEASWRTRVPECIGVYLVQHVLGRGK